MSTSEEVHIHAPQALVLEYMLTYYRHQGGTVEMMGPPLDMKAYDDLLAGLNVRDECRGFAVLPTDADGWTILFADVGAFAEYDMLRSLTGELQTSALYGLDYVSGWYWLLFEQGQERACAYYDDGTWDGPDPGSDNQSGHWPKDAQTLLEVFAAHGRKYRRLSWLDGPLGAAEQVGVPQERVVILLVTDAVV